MARRTRNRINSHGNLLALITLVTTFLSCSSVAHATEANTAHVEHKEGRFIVHSNLLVRLPVSQVRAILMDFGNLPAINKNIQHVEMLDSGTRDAVRMRIRSKVCAIFICLNYNWVQDVKTLSSGDIVTRFDSADSDFREGWVLYRLRPRGNATRLITNAILVPDFWFPPVVGRLVMERRLRTAALDTAASIEAAVRLSSVAPSDKRLAFQTQ